MTNVYKHCPDNTAFKQQRLPAWQPLLTAKTVYPTFFAIAVIFIPVGIILFMNSQNVVEFVHDYTDCYSSENIQETCGLVRSNQFRMNETCTCRHNFTLTKAMPENVFAYYGLTNFFQNHRRYVKSRDDNQLVGNHVDLDSVSSDCRPYSHTVENGILRVIAPCGAVANSLFNDTYTLIYSGSEVPLLRTDIAWSSDYNVKFNNPPPVNDLNVAFSRYAKPLFWQTSAEYLDNSSILNNGYQNEALIVWMRTAAFPQFRKVYGRLDRRSVQFSAGLLPGDYSLIVSYNYPVTSFFGRKRFILSTTSWIGGKNSFLGIAYIVVGCLALITSLALCCMGQYARKIHATKERK